MAAAQVNMLGGNDGSLVDVGPSVRASRHPGRRAVRGDEGVQSASWHAAWPAAAIAVNRGSQHINIKGEHSSHPQDCSTIRFQATAVVMLLEPGGRSSLTEQQPNVQRERRHAQLEDGVSKVAMAAIAKAPGGKPAPQMRAVHNVDGSLGGERQRERRACATAVMCHVWHAAAVALGRDAHFGGACPVATPPRGRPRPQAFRGHDSSGRAERHRRTNLQANAPAARLKPCENARWSSASRHTEH